VPDRAPSPLEEALGYRFVDRHLLRRALSHRSFDPEDANERLEFLGDSVLEFVVTAELYASSGLDEGEMTKVRISLVDRASLAEVAIRVGVGDAVLLGEGEERTGGRAKPSILADTLEAILGALYLDGGLAEVRRVVLALWRPIIADRLAAPGQRDYKTRLQETLAEEGLVPEYEVEGEGPEHARLFTAVVRSGGRMLGRGAGTSKKRAEQAAARRALESRSGAGSA
jgi:ribonuclease-3